MDESFRYVSVGIAFGHKLFDAFAPIVKDSLRSKQFRSRDVDLAGDQRCVCVCVWFTPQ